MTIKYCALRLQLEAEKRRLSNTSQISDAETVQADFMEKLNNNELTRDTEPTIGKELTLDKGFVDKRLESYERLLKSPLMQEVHDHVFVKK